MGKISWLSGGAPSLWPGGRGGEAEAYVEHSVTTSIKVYQGRPEAITVAEPRGVGIRFIRENRLGYAYTSDLSQGGIGAAVEAAVAASTAAEPDPFSVLPEATAVESIQEQPPLWLPGLGQTNLDSKVALAVEAEAAALQCHEVRGVEETVYSDVDKRVAVVSSRGVSRWGAATYAVLYVYAHAEREGETRSGLAAAGSRAGAQGLKPREVGEEAAARACRLLGAGRCPSGTYTVVLEQQVVGGLLSAIAPAFSAEAIQKGRSVFADRIGSGLGPPSFHLWDDGLCVDGPSSFWFDDEGVARTTRTPLIHNGVLASFLYDSRTAARGDTSSTANAVRASYRSLPLPSTTNLIVEVPGSGDIQALAERVGDGLYVVEVNGLHSGINSISGEISVGVSGLLIRGGSLCEPVHEITMATDMPALFAGITDAAGDTAWDYVHGGVLTPSLALRDIAVSGS